MERDEIIQCVCRDGIPARVQLVAYQGRENCMVYFGYRQHPELAEFDMNGQRNESGDMWDISGFWLGIAKPHAFDLVKKHLSATKPETASAYG